MRRREFITLLGGAAAWPLAARAQQPERMRRIGVLNTGLDDAVAGGPGFRSFIAELQRLGFAEGRNLKVHYGRTDQGADLLFADAAEMPRQDVEVIVANGGTLALQAALAASKSLPIVMLAANYNPIERGFVAGLARPGGNITGLFFRLPELAQKRVELLNEAFPDRTRLACLWDASSADQFAAAERTAQALKLNLHALKLENPPYDFEAAFRDVAESAAQALLVLSSTHFAAHRAQIAGLALRQRLPAMFTFKAYVEAGGLMSYGVDAVPMWRRAASLTAKILRGAMPADLPVEQATVFEFVVNLRTARSMGIELPTSILLRADEVIE